MTTYAAHAWNYIMLFLANVPALGASVVAAVAIPFSLFVGKRAARPTLVLYLVAGLAAAVKLTALWLAAQQPVWAPASILTGVATLVLLYHLVRRPTDERGPSCPAPYVGLDE